MGTDSEMEPGLEKTIREVAGRDDHTEIAWREVARGFVAFYKELRANDMTRTNAMRFTIAAIQATMSTGDKHEKH